MRVLFLTRQRKGNVASVCQTLADALDEFDVEAVIDEASSWIPDKTGWLVDRGVSKKVMDASRGFDIIHAWGYRAAWACSEAFYIRKPWVYTQLDPPRTTHPQLIDRLNAARVGFCSCRLIRERLAKVDTLHLRSMAAPVSDPPNYDKLDERRRLGLEGEGKIILASGAWGAEGGLQQAIDAVVELQSIMPNVQLILANLTGSRDEIEKRCAGAPLSINVIGEQPSLLPWLAASDLALITKKRGGVSITALEAMSLEVPVLARRGTGTDEIAVDGLSAFYFGEEDSLACRIEAILNNQTALESVGRGGRTRTEDSHSASEVAGLLAARYKEILDR